MFFYVRNMCFKPYITRQCIRVDNTLLLLWLILLLLSIMLVIKQFDLWKKNLYVFLVFVWQIVVSIFFDPQLLPLAPNTFFCFSNHQVDAFFFFLLFSISLSILQWYRQEGKLFLEYVQSNWLSYAGFYWLTNDTYIKCI